MIRLLLALTLALGIVAPTVASAQSLSIAGPDGRIAMTASEIGALPKQQTTLTIHGQSHVFSGPTLASVLERVGAPLGDRLRGPTLATYVLVEAADGYRVVLSLAEIDPAISPTAVLLADAVDGHPLASDDGPFRLVVEGDARPARSARQVTAITVRTAD